MSNLPPAEYIAHFANPNDPIWTYQSYRCKDHLSESNFRLLRFHAAPNSRQEPCVVCLEYLLTRRREQREVLDSDAHED